MYRFFIFIALLLFVGDISAQKYMMGLEFDDTAYAKTSSKPLLISRSYNNLPAKASLKPYCPTPGHQGNHGTCTGWATAWAARSIVENIANKATKTSEKTKNTFSPLFVYASIQQNTTPNCLYGTYPGDAFELLKTQEFHSLLTMT